MSELERLRKDLKKAEDLLRIAMNHMPHSLFRVRVRRFLERNTEKTK